MRKRSIIVILFILVTSCSKGFTDFERQLIGNNWYYYPREAVLKNIEFMAYLQFHEDHTVENRYVSSGEIFADFEKSNSEDTWSFDAKSNSLTIFNREFLVESYTKDTIVMQEKGADTKSLLIRYVKAK